MTTISVPYRIMVEDTPPPGPVVRYLVRWADAFTFFDEILGQQPPVGVAPPRVMGMEPKADEVFVATHGEVEGRGMSRTADGMSFTDAIVEVSYGIFPAHAGA